MDTTRVSSFDRVCRYLEDWTTTDTSIFPEEDIGLIDAELDRLTSRQCFSYTIYLYMSPFGRESEEIQCCLC